MPQEPSPAFPAVRTLILAQHQELRQLLRTGVALTGAAPRDDGQSIDVFLNLIESLLDNLTLHLAFEEATLVPLLRTGDAVDLAHAERLAKEHQHQRKELQVLLTLARSECDPQTVVTIFRNLLSDLILDMESEERWLLEVGPSAERNAS
jgi:iron-sulfur cluster repair protein YtfE (RIC family)